MASNPEDLSTKSVSSNGRKRRKVKRKVSSKKIKDCVLNEDSNGESNEGVLLPELMVKVEVCEVDGTVSTSENTEASTTTTNKSVRKQPSRAKKKPQLNPEIIKPVPKIWVPHYNFKCEKCGRRYVTEEKMRRHVKSHDKEDTTCPLCKVVFKTKIYLTKHLSKHGEGVDCNQCDAKFHTQAQLDKHKIKHIEDEFLKVDGTKWSPAPLNSTKLLSIEEVSEDIQNAIVSKMHKGRSVPDICQIYNITEDVVNEIWNGRDKFIQTKKVGKRSVRYMNSIVEPLVFDWYTKQRDKGIQVTGKMFQHVAENKARENGLVHFDAGTKWLEQFKKRYNIYLNKRKRDYSNIPQESIWKTKFFKDHWSGLRTKYSDDEVYTADEVGLFYNPSKSRERKLGGKKFIHGGVSERLSVLLCSNISGLDKRKLLVCGSEDPLKRSSRNPNSLPVNYHRHEQCHFTTPMFENYIKEWNDELKRSSKLAMLILDRASIHSKVELSNLKLVFLPWKASNGLMPIKNGVFQSLRSEFRNLLLQFKVANVLRGVDRHLTCLEALEMLSCAWERTPSQVITKSFIDIGYVIQTLPGVEEKSSKSEDTAESLCNILKDYSVEQYFTDVSSLDMYLTVDEELLVGQGTNPSVFGGNHKVVEPVMLKANEELPLNTEKPQTNEKEMFLRKTRALGDLDIVRNFLQTNDTSYKSYCSFLDIEKVVMDNFVKLSQ